MQNNKFVNVTLSDLVKLAQIAKTLPLNSMKSEGQYAGQHTSVHLGRGMEFAEARRYNAGDDIRTIDWKLTARTGKAHTKLFSMEKERSVYLCIDMRRPMFFATRGKFKSVQAATLSALIAWNTIQEGNKVSAVIFNDKKVSCCPLTSSKPKVVNLLNTLTEFSCFSSDRMEKTQIATMEEALSQLIAVVGPGSLVYIISDFRKPSDKLSAVLFGLAKKSQVILCQIYDQIEQELPKNTLLKVTDGLQEKSFNTFKTNYVEAYNRSFIDRQEMIKAFCHHRNIKLINISTQVDIAESAPMLLRI